MLSTFIEAVLNLSLLFAMLGAPSLLLIARWYRTSLGKHVFVWAKPEMVVLTIVFFTVALMLFIVGVSCIFSHFGYLDTNKFPAIAAAQYLNVGLACFLLITGLGTVYFSLRQLLVNVVLEHGIVLNRGLLPRPRNIRSMSWEIIADYYVVPDYPNATFTFIVHESAMHFGRVSVKVPIYLKEDFQGYLDKKLHSVQVERHNSEIGSRRFSSEN